MSRCGFLWIYPIWCSLSFLILKMYIFCKIREILAITCWNIFCQILFSHSGTIITCMLDILLTSTCFRVFINCFLIFFSLFFRLDYLFIHVQAHWLFVISILILSPFSKSFISDIIFFSSKISKWFSFIVSISAEKFYLSINFKRVYLYLTYIVKSLHLTLVPTSGSFRSWHLLVVFSIKYWSHFSTSLYAEYFCPISWIFGILCCKTLGPVKTLCRMLILLFVLAGN